MTLIRASMATAIPDRSKVLNGLETLVIGAAGGLLFLWAGLPGGLISGAMCAVGIAALAGLVVWILFFGCPVAALCFAPG